MPTRMMVLACFLICSCGFAQTAAAGKSDQPLPGYDIVSIKPNNTGDGHLDIRVDDGNYSASNISALVLIQNAYSYKPDQIIGLTGPLSSARFDIRAKILQPDKARLSKLTREQYGQMLQPILTDRFHLKTHMEKHDMPIYRLVRDKGPSKIVQTSASNASGGSGTDFHGTSSGSVTFHCNSNRCEYIGHDIPISRLTDSLSSQVSRTVLDDGSFPGKYDVWLRYAPDTAPPPSTDSTEEALPGIFTALHEQLGLKMEGEKAPVDVLVIDHIDMPDPD